MTTILHDLGLSEVFNGPLRFEVEGANVAREFARKEGMDVRRSQLIWDGVALNSTPSDRWLSVHRCNLRESFSQRFAFKRYLPQPELNKYFSWVGNDS